MVNTDNIKDMITLIERNNDQYHEALNNLAYTFNKSISDNLRCAIAKELAKKDPENIGERQRVGTKKPLSRLGRLFSRKG